MSPESRVVGKRLTGREFLPRVRGSALYAADMVREGLLHAAVVRSPIPHGEILAIDDSAARAVPGVRAVFTAKDVPGTNRYGLIKKDQHLFSDGRVRFVGDAMAMVVAESAEAAEEGRRAVRVDYRALPAVFDPDEALRPDAPQVHEGGNVACVSRIERGDAQAALRRADVVVENTYSTSMIEHAFLEPHAALGEIDEEGRVAVHVGTQDAHANLRDVAALLGLPEERCRIVQAATGGAFGGKIDLTAHGFVALAAHRLRRPVKLVMSREEVFLASNKRHPMRIHAKTGATRDGKLAAVWFEAVADAGAYTSATPGVTSRCAIHAAGPYEIENVHVAVTGVYTNHPICGAMRGFGVGQATVVHESQMDLLARELGMDPIELRLRNALRRGSTTGTGQVLGGSVAIGETLRQIRKVRERRIQEGPPASPREGPGAEGAGGRGPARRTLYGMGVASMWHGVGVTGLPNPSSARLEVDEAGELTLFTGAADMGQGATTVLGQVAAEEMGLPFEAVRVVQGDTGRTPEAGISAATRQTFMSGNAIRLAAEAIKRELVPALADVLEARAEDIRVEDGFVAVRGTRGRGLPFAEAARRAVVARGGVGFRGEATFEPETTPLDPQTGRGKPYMTYSFGSQLVEVAVDADTGEVKVLRVAAAHEVGRAINPLLIEGQLNGGVAMGMGYGLLERFDPYKTRNFQDYHLPRTTDAPEVECLLVEEPDPFGPFGAKGVGEPPLHPTAPAILNAIHDATGIRIRSLPVRREEILKALRASGGAEAGRRQQR
ncbi:MAG: xanthine dehydrogenase family protein molybdopterin-binding subunit [Candidatus Tectomicrobia bacterium]|nr:xanthine dehydrogenase family protein molybdopterin-binding subunit [Candidatus Tectomicrobia bacterium]